MAKPVVTCNVDVVLEHSASPQTVALGATASGFPTSWLWTMLFVPLGSTANVGAKGSFTDGASTAQNPSMIADANVDGGYTLQCVATNGDGDSDPLLDRCGGQQAVIVRTEHQRLTLPGDFLYDWGEKYINPTLRTLEGATDISGTAEKVTPVAADLLLIEDSADGNAKKRIQVGSIASGVDATAIHKATAGEFAALTEKVTPIAADLLLIEDSAAGNVKRKVQVGSLVPTENVKLGKNVLHVDGARVDSYTADGTLARPYKTIGAAMAAASGTSLTHIEVAKGVYTENVVFKDYTHVSGPAHGPVGYTTCNILGTVSFPVGVANWSSLHWMFVSGWGAAPSIALVGYAGIYHCSVGGSDRGVVADACGYFEIGDTFISVPLHALHLKNTSYGELYGDVHLDGGTGANKDLLIETGSELFGVLCHINFAHGNVTCTGPLTLDHSPSEREQEFTASGGDQTFTLAKNVAANPNLPAGYAILGVWRNGGRLRYMATPTTNAHYGFTTPTSVVCKDLTASDIIAVQYGTRY